MKEQNNITKQKRITSLETFIMNICTIEDEKYNSYKHQIEKIEYIQIIIILIELIMCILGEFYIVSQMSSEPISNIVAACILYLLIWVVIGLVSIIVFIIIDGNIECKWITPHMNRIVSIYNHEDIMSLQHSNPYMLLLLKFILIPDNVCHINIKAISDMLVKNNIKHKVKEVDNNFTLIIYFKNKEYMITSSSLLSTTLTMPDNLRLDVLEICNLDESLSNESDWDEIVKYIKKHNDIEKERTMMNHINELNNISV